VWEDSRKTVSYCFLKNEWAWYDMVYCLKTSLARARVGTQWLHSTVDWWVNVFVYCLSTERHKLLDEFWNSF
jgi:hypothetical protein